jgi:hypothetical protein
MVLPNYGLKWFGKIQQWFTFFKLMKVRSTLSRITFLRTTHVQTEGQSGYTSYTVIETYRSLFSQSLHAILFYKFLPRNRECKKTTYISKFCRMLPPCRPANSCYIKAHKTFRPRRGQSSGTVAFEQLCIK